MIISSWAEIIVYRDQQGTQNSKERNPPIEIELISQQVTYP